MLPHPSNVRSRYKANPDKGIVRLDTAINNSALRYKNLPTRMKILLGVSLLGSLIFYGLIFRTFLSNDLTNESYLETDKCPACYGMSACTMLFYNRISMKGWSKIRLLDFTNVKNVHFAHSQDHNSVVLKKLGHDTELREIDDEICSDGNRPSGCDVARVIYGSSKVKTLRNKPIQPNMLTESAGMFTCGSYRLMDRLWKYYKERAMNDDIFFRDKIQLWYIAKVNTEPLMLQTFPTSENWPFPEYYGACGRFIVVKDAGRPLYDFYNAPFEKRADLGYQLLKMADMFSSNEDKFLLYWTDLHYENLSVDESGKLTFTDLENIIVVDVMALEATKPKGWDDILESDFDECDRKNCLSFSTEDLCSHTYSDHNFYAACRNILSLYANEEGYPAGLLHDMPEHARDYWDLDNLLNECARPHVPQGRLKVKDKIIAALDNLRNASPYIQVKDTQKTFFKKFKARKDDDV